MIKKAEQATNVKDVKTPTLPGNIIPQLSTEVQDPQGNWIAPDIEVRADYDKATGRYKWQTSQTPVRQSYSNVTAAGFKDGQWGVDTRTGFAVPWTDRGTTVVDGKTVPAQWNADKTIMSPEQYTRYGVYGNQNSSSAEYLPYYNYRLIHSSNPHIRELAIRFADTGEYTPVDPTKLYDRDAFYRGDADAITVFDNLTKDLGYWGYKENPFSHPDRKNDTLYKQMFFDNNKRQLYDLASKRAFRWLAMNGLTQSRNWDYKSSTDKYTGSTYASTTQDIIDSIPGYNSMSIEEKMVALRAKYNSIAQAVETDEQRSTDTAPSYAPYISMMYHRLSLEHQNTLASPGRSSSTPSSSYSITGNYIDPSIPEKDRGLGYYWSTAWGYTPGYDSRYAYAIFRPTDRVQIDTANHFGLLGKDRHGYYVLPQEEIANNFVNNNKWFWDPDEYLKHISWLQSKGQQDASKNTNWNIFYATPGAYTRSQHLMPGSSAAPTWMASNPLFRSLDANYIKGVGQAIDEARNYTERVVGIGATALQSYIRGITDKDPTGILTAYANKWYKYSMGEDLHTTVHNAAKFGVSPATLTTVGTATYSLPTLLLASFNKGQTGWGAAATTSYGIGLNQAAHGNFNAANGFDMASNWLNGQSFIPSVRSIPGIDKVIQGSRVAGTAATLADDLVRFTAVPVMQDTARAVTGDDRRIADPEASAVGTAATTAGDLGLTALSYIPGFTGKFFGGMRRFGIPLVRGYNQLNARNFLDQVGNPDAQAVDYVVNPVMQPGIASWLGADKLAQQRAFRTRYLAAKEEATKAPNWSVRGHESSWYAQNHFGDTETDMLQRRASGAVLLWCVKNETEPSKLPAGFQQSPEFMEFLNTVDPGVAERTYIATQMRTQAATGVVPNGFFSSPEFRSLDVSDKLDIFKFYAKAQGMGNYNPTSFADFAIVRLADTPKGQTPDLDIILDTDKGILGQDPRFNDLRMQARELANSLTMKDALSLVAQSGDNSGNNIFKSMVMASPAIANFDFQSVIGNPDMFNKVIGLYTNNQNIRTFIDGKLKDQAVRGQIISGIQALEQKDFITLLNRALNQPSEASVSALPKELLGVMDAEVQRRLKSGGQYAIELAHTLTPHLRTALTSSEQGITVTPGTAKAFMHVMTQPGYWEAFDPNTRLQFCEFLASQEGRRSLGALPEEERAEWLDKVKGTIQPILRQDFFGSFDGSAPFDNARRIAALYFRMEGMDGLSSIASEPFAYYGTIAAIALGGISVFSNIFSSDDDEDEDDEDSMDDDAAYRKRIRQSLKQKEDLDLDLKDDESD